MLSLDNLKRDLPASVVVFFVALPLCLGIALASGAPLFSGLIAGVVGGALVGAISRSPLGVSGPAAGLAVIVFGAIETLGSFQTFLLAVFIAGLIQVGLGVVRAGVLGYFFPSAVIHGMLSGIGLIIILKQIPHAFGYDSNPEGDLAFAEADGGTTLSALSEMLAFIHPGALVIALISMAILIVWDKPFVKSHRILGLFPGPVVAVVVAVLCQVTASGMPAFALSADHLVNVPVANSVGEFVGLFTLPDFSQIGNPAVWTVAITIAIVASLETLLSVEATDKMDPMKRTTPTNRELFAQGIGNSVSGLIGGLPVTQVIVRSTVNVQTGARTRTSAIVHGVLLLVCIATVPGLLNLIPLAVLAAVLIVTGYKLAKPAQFIAMWRYGFDQFLPFVVTVAGVVFTDLLMGVCMGMAVAIIILLQCNFKNSHFLNKKDRQTANDGHYITMRLAEEVTFLNKGAIKKELSEVPDNSVLVIDQRHCVYLNHDVAEIIRDFVETAETRGIKVEIIQRDEPQVDETTTIMVPA
ncbi:MAG: SulP family inorganic anion transporter [Pseudohongiellaceae bacterium]